MLQYPNGGIIAMYTNEREGYWIPFASIHGEIWVEGAYPTMDAAMIARESAKSVVTPPARYGVPFFADSKEEALKRASLFV